MNPFVSHFQEAGHGAGVVCLHASASTSSQWRPLMTQLAPDYRVLAPDLLGAGNSPAWPTERVATLRDELALIEPVLKRAGEPLFLVGHSYGAAVALHAALAQPQRVRAIAVYEPTLFALLEQERSGHDAAQGIVDAARDAAASIRAGDRDAAARRFVDYWSGPGTWDDVPPARRPAIAAAMVNVAGWMDVMLGDPTRLAAFAALQVPVLYMVGARSPASSRGVARLLVKTLPTVRVLEFAELGHMGPVTHPQIVNGAIGEFLDRHARGSGASGSMRIAASPLHA